ncbi:hypothetical protein S245_001556, partial [Arachis hypogaea]
CDTTSPSASSNSRSASSISQFMNRNHNPVFSLSLQLMLSRLWFILSCRRLLACTAVFSPVSSSARPTTCRIVYEGGNFTSNSRPPAE